MGILSPALAFAFSGYGSGGGSDPYQIGTCAELQDIRNDLSASYVLIRDINCTGTSFTSIGPVFTGTLDGQDHTVTGLSISGEGLFDSAQGATVENIILISGTVTGGSSMVGSVMGTVNAGDTTLLQNVHSYLNVSGSTYTGGLVGNDATGSLTVNQSSYNGILTSHGSTGSYAGGLAGQAFGTFANDYVKGMINTTNAAGGLFGITDTAFTVSNSYSYISIDVGGQSNQGGLIGVFSGGNVNNVFSANLMTGAGSSNVGGMFGAASASASNSYYDSYTEEALPCAGSGTQGCTAVNVSNSSPNYFKQGSSNAPLDGWNFSNIWQYNTGGYPTLQNENDFGAADTPNSNDANGDGVQDNYEQNVASEMNTNSIWNTVEIPTSTNCSVANPHYESVNVLASDAYFTPQMGGFLDYTINCPTAGASVPVTIIYDKQYDTSGWALRFYNSTKHTYSTISGAVFGSMTIGGVTETTVTYTVTDGGTYDSDDSTNGTIVDPVGPAVLGPSQPGVPDTGSGLYMADPFNTLADYTMIAGGLLALGFTTRKYATKNIRRN
jgi:hypothetical protein